MIGIRRAVVLALCVNSKPKRIARADDNFAHNRKLRRRRPIDRYSRLAPLELKESGLIAYSITLFARA